jgi:hypothetical protein
LKELPGREAYGLRDQRGNGVANEAVRLCARLWKTEPIGEALDARGLAGCQGAVLRWVNEHQAILAQVSDNGAAWVPSTLPSVSVFETGFVVWELKIDAPYAHGGGGSFTLSESCKIAQVAL